MSSYQTAIEAMEQMLDAEQSILEQFNKKTYRTSFDSMYQRYLPAFDAIEELYHNVREPEEMLANMAKAITGSAQTQLDGIRKKNAREAAMMNLNMQMAVYVYPAILHYKGDSSVRFSEVLQREWKEAFPKSNVQAAELEYIEKGFHKKFCYITTAVCRTQQRGDNCYELNLLRDYRDGYLAERENGEELIRRYYDVAPTIVRHIDERENSGEIYQQIWDSYLEPCIHMIEKGKNEDCLVLYTRMVDDLQEQYFRL